MLRILNRIGLPLLLGCGAMMAGAQTYDLGEDTRLSIEQALETAKTSGASLRQRLQMLKNTHRLPDSLPEAGRAALDNARVRDLLGVDPMAPVSPDADDPRYPGGIFVFASFSMPTPALRQLMSDASDLGVPVVFNGFVNNSAFETEAALRRMFADIGTSHGFMIDPTLFTRFGIKAVPSVVSTRTVLEVCDTPGCAGDAIPPHDIVKGNIPLEAALRIIAEGKGDAPEPALAVLGKIP